MPPPLLGLHHVTATVADAQEDLDFCLDLLGLRLVKKTVNFDNRNVYHFYYGDEHGTPGTLWTTFPYKGWKVPVGEKGAGQIVATSFSVPASSLSFWESRLREHGVPVAEGRPRFSDQVLVFRDTSGLLFELVGDNEDVRTPWVSTIDRAHALRGLHSVSLVVRDPKPTLALMCGTLGYVVVAETDGRVRVAVGGSGAGHTIDILHDSHATGARNGLGTVHHVAMAIADGEQQLALREELIGQGLKVTEVRDRQYFTSIYFREPGGVLFEVATMGPGFTIDEDLRTLGLDLKLPPWEEPHRSEIETRLPQITYA
ncbi:MAG: ring-cleaving dioxygenase [Vicinamibacterales bacterium]